jgi:hypothetical protein
MIDHRRHHHHHHHHHQQQQQQQQHHIILIMIIMIMIMIIPGPYLTSCSLMSLMMEMSFSRSPHLRVSSMRVTSVSGLRWIPTQLPATTTSAS